jgi:hypothetical protein
MNYDFNYLPLRGLAKSRREKQVRFRHLLTMGKNMQNCGANNRNAIPSPALLLVGIFLGLLRLVVPGIQRQLPHPFL